MNKEFKDDINEYKTELMIKLMIMAALYEFLYMHKIPIKVIISEYLKVADFFVQDSQKGFFKCYIGQSVKINDELKKHRRF